MHCVEGVPAEGLHPAGFLIATTNCRDPLNHSDPQCWQGQFTNLSFYLANTNYSYKGVWPVGDTGADGWLEGPAMRNYLPGDHLGESWNNVSVTWTPDTGSRSGGETGETGVLTMSSAHLDPGSAVAVSSTTQHRLANASNLGGSHYDWVFGASRFPKSTGWAPCHHFFGELRDLKVWNGVGCGREAPSPRQLQ